MKKKSFFSGFNAKMALAIVALSGALLTGCYKDDGLDVNGPAGEVILPNATYTITGSVVNPNGELIANGDATMTIGGASVELNGGSFTYQTETTGPVSIVVTPKNTEVYKGTVTTTVDIKEVAAGQAAVYNKTIVLPFADVVPEPEPEYVDVEYNLNIVTYASNNLTTPMAPANYSVKINNAALANPYAAGVVNVLVEPTDALGEAKANYGIFTTAITLQKYQVLKDAPESEKIVNVLVNAVLPYTNPENPEDIYIYKSFNANFILVNKATVTSIELQKFEGTNSVALENAKVENTNSFTYSDKILEQDANKYTYKMIVNWKNAKGEAQETRTYDCNALVNSIIDQLDGYVPEESEPWNKKQLFMVDGVAGDELDIPDNVFPFLNGKEYLGNIYVERLQTSDLTILGMFRGTPLGVVFESEADKKDGKVMVSFNQFGTEFGNVTLVNINNEPIKEEGFTSEIGNDKYTLNIPHFSTFGAKINFKASANEVVPSSKAEKYDIGRKNDTDYGVNVTIRYKYATGSQFDIETAIESLGFTNPNAKERAKALILNDLASRNIVNNWKEDNASEFIFTVAPYTCLESYTIEESTETTTYTYEIGSKTVSLDVTTAVKTEVKDVKTFTFGHGHGHSHDHGNSDLNAGGGIIEAE